MKSVLLLALLALLIIPAVIATAVDKIPTIIDVDNGPDDILAVIAALRSDKLDVKAITISGDTSQIDSCAVDMTRIVNALKPGSKIPVVRAFPRQLKRNPQIPVVVDSIVRNDKNTIRNLDERYAHDIIIDTAILSNPITILASGPLGNISIATNKHRGPMYGINRLYWTGGKYPVVEQISSIIETNEYVDPISNKEVFSSDYSITTFGNIDLDRTYTPAECERLISILPSECKNIFRANFRHYMKTTGQTTCPINALIGVAACLNPQIITASQSKSKTTLIESIDYDILKTLFTLTR
jgi:inosine-uridine nucleoside N-ribohydrolase